MTHEHDHPTHHQGPYDASGHSPNGSGHETPRSDSPALIVELREHVPFSVSAVAIGLTFAGIVCVLAFSRATDAGVGSGAHGHDGAALNPARAFFHLFHPMHMLFSAAATAAMYQRYEHKRLKAVIIGLIGAIGVCGVSDIVMPQASLAILGVQTPWHICIVEHPMLVCPFAAVGVLVGIAVADSVVRSTIISHSLHVFASTMASVFYMVGPLGIVAWIDRVGEVFLFVVLAVMIPCCVSDIVFPMLMSSAGRSHYAREPHAH